MGVKELWSILEPVKKKQTLSDLSNKTLCVDLSFWVCEALHAKELSSHVNKPHLRNLFYRFCNLTRFRVKLVFVLDGKPPELKWEAMKRRIEATRGGPSRNNSAENLRIEGSYFAECVRECCTLLELLGVPCLRSEGEAEALCALLNFHQVVDGCITNDGDALLYGARTVYKDLSASKRNSCVFCYKMDDIERDLSLNRDNLVAFAVLVGCDYLPHGVQGVGKKKAMELISTVNHSSLLDRFDEWTKESCEDDSLSKIERKIKGKALKDNDFARRKAQVIEEYYRYTESKEPPQVSFKTTSPDLARLQEFCQNNLRWSAKKAQEEVLPLITNWQMTSLIEQSSETLVQPQRIVKCGTKDKVECYDIEWQNVKLGDSFPLTFETTERRDLFHQVYPTHVAEFESAEEAINSAKKSSRKRKQNAAKESNRIRKNRRGNPDGVHDQGQPFIDEMLKKRKSTQGGKNAESDKPIEIIELSD
ncbi:flap endonuclease GEN homolog 1-like [Montipora foliosa]|uniref:flap endonuclease GEN homolog 1-like n=1 Tax=Montipora foliosa TaxID=591990 RepID=UPI0035F12414